MKRPAVLAAAAALLAGAFALPASAAGRAPRDTRRPTVAFTTADGGTLYYLQPAAKGAGGRSVPGEMLRGRAADDLSGVKQVLVTWIFDVDLPENGVEPPCTRACTQKARLACASAARRSCTWSAEPPSYPGRFRATAEATDVAGNRARTGTITVFSASAPMSTSPEGRSSCGGRWARSAECTFFFTGAPISVWGEAVAPAGTATVSVWVHGAQGTSTPVELAGYCTQTASRHATCAFTAGAGVLDAGETGPLVCEVEGMAGGTFGCASG